MSNYHAEEGLKLLNALVPENNPYAFKLDEDGNPVRPILVLCNRNGDKINVIENVCNVKQVFSFSSVFELSFDVYEYANGKRCSVWDEIKDFRLVYLPQYKLWFEIYVTTKDDNGLTKSISATHLNEAELSVVNLYGIEINTEDDLKLHSYAPTVFFNADKTELSLIHRLLNKMPHYQIIHVDKSLMNLQRNFEFDDVSIMDAFDEIAEECECVFIFGEGVDDDNSITRTISVYDMLDYCEDCGERGEFDDGFCTKCSSTNIVSRYGMDTNVFISNENLANELIYSNDTDSIKNCFHFEAGDDLMTAAIMDCNMGSSYVWYIPEETRLCMSPELQERLLQYDADSVYYTDEHVSTFDSAVTSSYNDVIFKYKTKNEELETIFSITGYAPLIENYYRTVDLKNYLQTSMMPTTTLDETSAGEQITLLTTDNMSPIGVEKLSTLSVSTADSAVKNYAKVYIDSSKYNIKISDSTLNENKWKGFITLVSFSDEDDTATTLMNIVFNEDVEVFTKQKIDKLLAKQEEVPNGVVSLFNLSLDDFANEITNHSRDNLDLFYKCGEDVINLLIEDGHYKTDSELRDSLYIPTTQKIKALQDEIVVREQEIDSVISMQNALKDTIDIINKKMSMESYLGDLWVEYISYRREDNYSNTNYISDGLTNKEIILQAQLFHKAMLREIKKSATLQHSIETSLKNLLILPEFKPILYKFQLANWIRIKIDGIVYKLRLDSYTVDYEDLSNLSVTFTDIRDQNSVIAQVKRTFAQNKSKSSTYSSTARQMVSNQPIVSTTTGVLVRNYSDDFNNFKTGQIRVLSTGIYYTDDNWNTVQGVRETIAATQDKLSQIIAGAGGIFTTEEEQPDGSKIYYLHNKANLSDSETIWKMTSDAFGVSTDGGKTWNAGLTVDGEMITKILTTVGINANWINSGALNVTDDNGNVVFHVGIDDKTVILNGDSVFINSDGLTMGDAIDMAKSLAISISPAVHIIETNTDGSYDSFPETFSTVTVKFGRADVTSASTYSMRKTNGVECEFDKPTRKLTITELTTDSAEIFLTANYLGIESTVQLSIIKQKAIFSITEIKNYYNVSDSESVAPTEWFDSNIPAMTNEKRYLWSYEVTTYSDKTTNTTKPRVIGVYGDKGDSGNSVSVKETTITYAQSENGKIPPSEGWDDIIPTAEAGKYMWTKTIVLYSDDTKSEFCSVTRNGINGIDGEDGKSNYIHYAYATSADGSSGFSTSDSTDKTYIGVCTTSDMTDPTTPSSYSWSLMKGTDGKSAAITASKNEDGSVTITTVDPATGEKSVTVDAGENGTSIYIKSRSVEYTSSTSGTIAPETGWKESIPDVLEGEYLWTKTVVTYSDDTYTTSFSVGYKGTNGRGLVSVTEYYLVSSKSSGVTTDEITETEIPTMSETNRYLWNCEILHYSDGTSSEKTTPVIIGVYGAKGQTGVGIISIIPLYYCSASQSMPDYPQDNVIETGTDAYELWSRSVPIAYDVYQFYFQCNQVEYDNGTYAWTEIISNDAVQIANNAQNTAESANNTASTNTGRIDTVNDKLDLVDERTTDLEGDVSRIDTSIDNTNSKIDDLRNDTSDSLDALKKELLDELNDYRTSVEQYMKFNSTDGLILGATGKEDGSESPFKTVIDNTSMQFKEDNETIAYITNRQLNITSAVITDLTVGNFLFHSRGENQGLSIIWKGSE